VSPAEAVCLLSVQKAFFGYSAGKSKYRTNNRLASFEPKIQAVATSADDGLLFPPERYPELTNQVRQSRVLVIEKAMPVESFRLSWK
jgi:hypothetical protein